MGKNKDKGTRLEHAVRDLFRKYVDPKCERQIMSGADEWNKGDIRFSYKIPHNLQIECKNQERYDFWKWWAQTKDQASQFDKPVLVFTKNHKDTIVAMKLEDFMDIYEELVGYINQADLEKQDRCEHSKNDWMLKEAIKKIKDYLK